MLRNLSDSERVDYIIIGICIGFGLGMALSFLWIIA